MFCTIAKVYYRMHVLLDNFNIQLRQHYLKVLRNSSQHQLQEGRGFRQQVGRGQLRTKLIQSLSTKVI